jgi:hypothetical protein
MARVRARSVLVVLLAVLAASGLLVVWFWPGPTYRTEVVVRERFRERPVVRSSPGVPQPEPRMLRVEAVSRPLARRLAWAHERAAWRDGGWIVCDVTGLLPPGANLAELVRDERGWTGSIDPASSSMVVVEGWLPLAVTTPEGRAEFEVSEIFGPEVRLTVTWSGAVGEVPGSCTASAGPAVATLLVTVVPEEGAQPAHPDEIVEVVGCGYTTGPGARPAVAGSRCAVWAVRRAALLPTQVTVGQPVWVEPALGQDLEVHLTLPLDPSGELPHLDETLLLLDVAAFSGAEVLADHLEVVVDDLGRGEVDVAFVEGFLEGEGDTDAPAPDDVFEMIGAAWHSWGSLDE